MAITDIQISEELETNAPSIKYRGNEGPKSPQEMEMMMSGNQPLPEDPTNQLILLHLNLQDQFYLTKWLLMIHLLLN